MDESSFWSDRIRPVLKGRGRFFERIENGLSAGTPDVAFVIDGVCGRIENKWRNKLPVRSSSKVLTKSKGMRKEQIAWAVEYIMAGGRYFVLMGAGSATFLLRPTAKQVREMNSWTLDQFLCEAIYYAGEGRPLDGAKLIRALSAD